MFGIERDYNDRPEVKILQQHFPGEILAITDSYGDLAITLKRERILEICRLLRDDPAILMNLFIDLCGVDYLPQRAEPRFEVVYHLYSISRGKRLRLKIPLHSNDPALDSVSPVYEAANWFEREAFDLFGIIFNHHPFLRRLLCHHQFVGHALRKDYPMEKRTPCTEVWDLE